jgi:hypothetical protein
MRTTVNLDTDLLAEAACLTGVTELAALIHAGLMGWATGVACPPTDRRHIRARCSSRSP